MASTFQTPESGPALQPPVDFPKPNYSSGTSTSLRVTQRPARSPDDPSVHTRPETGDRGTTGKGCSAQTHHLTRSQPDVAGISDFALTHPRRVRKLTALFIPNERGRLSCLVPRVPECLLFFVANISGPVLSPHKVSRTKLPLQIKEELGILSWCHFLPQDKQCHPRLYEFLPYSYLS